MSGTKVAMAHPHSFQSGALSFMSCTSGRESSPMDENDSNQSTEFKTETKKKRFHPLRNLRRMFRRKTRRSSISADSYQPNVPENPEIPAANLEHRSCSTSRLQEENLTQNLIRNSRLNPGLSLSHDSIFTPDRADSGLSSSDLENSSLSITVLTPPSKECPMKSQSSCSETSLLSIGSSEVELSPVRGGSKSSDLDLGVTAYKLSHSAARHKMAVKPRRNHGAPRSRRRTLTKSPLPTTPEVSEEGTNGRSNSAMDFPDTLVQSLRIEKKTSDTKICWSQLTLETSTELEEKSSEIPKLEDEAEESTSQKAESFFGRFLSRRSEKKKKLVESNQEDVADDKHVGHFTKKFSKSNETRSGGGKTPNRRQRVEPVEIPPSPSNKEDVEGRKISSSMSPPKTYWSSQVTSRSTSPPKAVWPDTFSYYVKPDAEDWDCKTKQETLEVSPVKEPTESFLKDFKNPNFVKELTDSVSMFAKDETGKRKKEEDEEEGLLKARRQHSEDETPRKAVSALTTSNSSESVESMKSFESETTCVDVVTAPTSISIKTINSVPVTFDSVHDGYENIQIIEFVKQEKKNETEVQKIEIEKKPGEAGILNESEVVEVTKVEKEPEFDVNETVEVKKIEKETEVVRRVKPTVSEKPKDLKRAVGTGELKKVSLNRAEAKTPVETEEKVVPKARSTLVERRKSELMLLTEAEENDWKAKIKPLKKQTSFSEAEKRSSDGSPEEKTEGQQEEEVVLRKKSVTKDSDEQPELMKVFARRSLKVKETEKIEKMVEDMQRSRDSDKENEVVESPKEDRKKGAFDVEDKKDADKDKSPVKSKSGNEVMVSITSLKPEVASRKFVLQKYVRSLSENNAKQREEPEIRRETSVLEENKMRNITELKISRHLGRGEGKEGGRTGEEAEEETGFKRIQQRKAEWEKRAQQGAK